MAISKILDIGAGSKFAIKLPQDIRYDRESQILIHLDRVPSKVNLEYRVLG